MLNYEEAKLATMLTRWGNIKCIVAFSEKGPLKSLQIDPEDSFTPHSMTDDEQTSARLVLSLFSWNNLTSALWNNIHKSQFSGKIKIYIQFCPLNGAISIHNHFQNPDYSWYKSTHMMTSSNGNISALLARCAGNSPVTDEFPTQRPVTRSFDISLICALN